MQYLRGFLSKRVLTGAISYAPSSWPAQDPRDPHTTLNDESDMMAYSTSEQSLLSTPVGSSDESAPTAPKVTVPTMIRSNFLFLGDNAQRVHCKRPIQGRRVKAVATLHGDAFANTISAFGICITLGSHFTRESPWRIRETIGGDEIPKVTCYNTGILMGMDTGKISGRPRHVGRRLNGSIPNLDHLQSRSSNVQAKRMDSNAKCNKGFTDKKTDEDAQSETASETPNMPRITREQQRPEHESGVAGVWSRRSSGGTVDDRECSRPTKLEKTAHRLMSHLAGRRNSPDGAIGPSRDNEVHGRCMDGMQKTARNMEISPHLVWTSHVTAADNPAAPCPYATLPTVANEPGANLATSTIEPTACHAPVALTTRADGQIRAMRELSRLARGCHTKHLVNGKGEAIPIRWRLRAI